MSLLISLKKNEMVEVESASSPMAMDICMPIVLIGRL